MPERLEIRSEAPEVPACLFPACDDGFGIWILKPEIGSPGYRCVTTVESKAVHVGVRTPPHVTPGGGTSFAHFERAALIAWARVAC